MKTDVRETDPCMRQQKTQVSSAETMASQQIFPIADGNITLLDFCLVLHRNGVWLLAGVLAGIVMAFGWVLLPSPEYESHATIYIGVIREKGTLEDPAALTVRLMDRYGTESAQSDMPVLVRVVQASLTKNAPRSPHILKLVASANSPENANKFLTNIIESVAQNHREIYEGYLAPLRQQLATVEQEIKSMKSQIGQMSRTLGSVTASQPVQASLLALEKGRLVSQLNLLEIDRLNLLRQITDPFSASTRVVVPPTLPNQPARPGVAFTGAMGALFGLALGVVAAFFRDLYSNIRAVQNGSLSSPRPPPRNRIQ